MATNGATPLYILILKDINLLCDYISMQTFKYVETILNVMETYTMRLPSESIGKLNAIAADALLPPRTVLRVMAIRAIDEKYSAPEVPRS